ncbi:hypothetical protein L226DRAFT_170525 [Lentinus tigrinus ALCF2SS1-7]|uniref:uncharacterized protein n=1 Tax=Lentinus tigrinus ALCF2SS1-7 TaxID=1328758 RepID=UPI0011660319|nr:hypothetical protein L226DRAFT_170525 [Lentinus tigrinus ALCF2SS1-7]
MLPRTAALQRGRAEQTSLQAPGPVAARIRAIVMSIDVLTRPAPTYLRAPALLGRKNKRTIARTARRVQGETAYGRKRKEESEHTYRSPASPRSLIRSGLPAGCSCPSIDNHVPCGLPSATVAGYASLTMRLPVRLSSGCRGASVPAHRRAFLDSQRLSCPGSRRWGKVQPSQVDSPSSRSCLQNILFDWSLSCSNSWRSDQLPFTCAPLLRW